MTALAQDRKAGGDGASISRRCSNCGSNRVGFVPSVTGIAGFHGLGVVCLGSRQSLAVGQTWAMLANAVWQRAHYRVPLAALGWHCRRRSWVGTGLGARRGILIRDIECEFSRRNCRHRGAGQNGDGDRGEAEGGGSGAGRGDFPGRNCWDRRRRWSSTVIRWRRRFWICAAGRNPTCATRESFSSEPGLG